MLLTKNSTFNFEANNITFQCQVKAIEEDSLCDDFIITVVVNELKFECVCWGAQGITEAHDLYRSIADCYNTNEYTPIA